MLNSTTAIFCGFMASWKGPRRITESNPWFHTAPRKPNPYVGVKATLQHIVSPGSLGSCLLPWAAQSMCAALWGRTHPAVQLQKSSSSAKLQKSSSAKLLLWCASNAAFSKMWRRVLLLCWVSFSNIPMHTKGPKTAQWENTLRAASLHKDSSSISEVLGTGLEFAWPCMEPGADLMTLPTWDIPFWDLPQVEVSAQTNSFLWYPLPFPLFTVPPQPHLL